MSEKENTNKNVQTETNGAIELSLEQLDKVAGGDRPSEGGTHKPPTRPGNN